MAEVSSGARGMFCLALHLLGPCCVGTSLSSSIFRELVKQFQRKAQLPTARAVPGVQAIAASWQQTVIAFWAVAVRPEGLRLGTGHEECSKPSDLPRIVNGCNSQPQLVRICESSSTCSAIQSCRLAILRTTGSDSGLVTACFCFQVAARLACSQCPCHSGCGSPTSQGLQWALTRRMQLACI